MEYTGGDFCLKLLSDDSDLIRIEALRVLVQLSTTPLQVNFFKDLIMRVAILLDEGLNPANADSAITKDQTLLCLEILVNWLIGGQPEGEQKTEILGYFGLINQAIKLLGSSSLQVKQRSLHLLGSLQLTAHLVSEIFANPGLVT